MSLKGEAIKVDAAALSQREATFKDGCLSLRKDVIDIMRARVAPGPIYNPLSHVLSKEATVRSIKFGSGPPRFISETSQKNGPSKINHPGPQTYDPEAIRKAIKSLKGSCISGIKFGRDERDCNRVSRNKLTQPSPAEYDPEMIRRGIAFSKLSAPAHVKFQKACHNELKAEIGPGPQTYDPEAIRRGIILTKSKRSISVTETSKGKAASYRSKIEYPLQERSTKFSCKEMLPGPQHYDTEHIRRGLSMLSTNNRCSTGVKFGTGPRTINAVPVIREKIRASKNTVTSTFGPQSNSRFKTQPRCSFGAR